MRRYRAHYDVIVMRTLCMRLLCEFPEMSQTSGGLEIVENVHVSPFSVQRCPGRWLEVVVSEII